MIARILRFLPPLLALLPAIISAAAQGEVLSLQFSGTRALASGATTVEVDLFDTGTAEIRALSASGYVVQCYFSAGTWEDWRVDAKTFPKRGLGRRLADWPGERWLDIRSSEVRAKLAYRLDSARIKGCDRVDPDNVDGYAHRTGFGLSRGDSLDFARWLAREAHVRGLGIALKNAPDLITDLESDFDAAVAESCALYGWCADMGPFLEAGKPVFAIEYPEFGVDETAACATADALGISMVFKNRSLDEWERRCE